VPFLHYQEVGKDKIEYKIRQRYVNFTKELLALDFEEYTFLREMRFPLSAVVLLPLLVNNLWNREMLRIENPLRIVTYRPLLVHEDYASYGTMTVQGVRFYTRFADGGMLVTTNYGYGTHTRPEKGYFRYNLVNATVERTWNSHCYYMKRLESAGRLVSEPLSFKDYVLLSRLDNRMMLRA
jgi:hypothetical protein